MNPTPRPPYGSPSDPFNQGSNPFSSSTQALPVAQLSTDERLDFLRRTYSWFLAGILCAIVMGIVTMSVPGVFAASVALTRNPLLAFLLLIGASLGAQAVSRTPGLNYAALFGFTGFMGFWITPFLAIMERSFPGITTQAAVLTGITFSSLTAFVFVSKQDFSFLRTILFVSLVALILGGLANAFLFHSALGEYLMAWVSVVVFSGFILYKTSNIMQTHDRDGYISAALGLFISFINLFLSILRVLAGSRR